MASNSDSEEEEEEEEEVEVEEVTPSSMQKATSHLRGEPFILERVAFFWGEGLAWESRPSFMVCVEVEEDVRRAEVGRWLFGNGTMLQHPGNKWAVENVLLHTVGRPERF